MGVYVTLSSPTKRGLGIRVCLFGEGKLVGSRPKGTPHHNGCATLEELHDAVEEDVGDRGEEGEY